MIDSFHTLAAYAGRLLRLGGGDVIGGKHNPYFLAIDEAAATAGATGTEFISFANYDYLGLARHPEIEAAANDAVSRFGSGALASRIVGGERTIHRELERELADFCRTEDALTLVSGYLTNASLLTHLLGPNDLILMDELSHASISNGAKCSRATSEKFRHNDLDHLEYLLREKRADHGHCLIVVEGLYSMDGDVPDLPRLLALKEDHRAWAMIDEAHSHGVLGDTGRGICEHFGEDPARVDLTIGTLSKAFVSCGGFIAAAKPVIDLLRFGLPGFIFSVGMPPMVAATALKAVQLVKAEPWRVKRLTENTEYFMARARDADLDTGTAIGRAVVPILYPKAGETMIAAAALLDHGIYAPPIVQIGVPKDMPRIRFFISANHGHAEIDRAIAILVETAGTAERNKIPSSTAVELTDGVRP